MEVFRRLGVAQAVRDAGLPHDFPNDISFRTTFVGAEFARIPIPCRRDRYTRDGGAGYLVADAGAAASDQPDLSRTGAGRSRDDDAGLRFRHRVKVLGFTQSADGVVTEAEDLDSGERLLIDSDYLVGCDGGHSEIRRQIGARLTGDRGGAAHAIHLFPRAVIARA